MIAYLFTGALSIAMVGVIVYDARHYLIPNRLNLLIVALFVVACFLLPLNPLPAAATAAGVFLIGLGLFALGLMGGGDIKLLAALSLWTGWPTAIWLFFLTAMFGAVLVAVILPLRVWLAPRWPLTRALPRILTRREPVPYGLAIAAAFLFLLWVKGIPGVTSPG